MKRKCKPLPPLEAALRVGSLGRLAQLKVCKQGPEADSVRRDYGALHWMCMPQEGSDEILRMIANGRIPVYAVREWPPGGRMYLVLQLNPRFRIHQSRPRVGDL